MVYYMLGRSWTSWGQGKHRRSRYQGKNNSFKIPMELNPHNYVGSELILSLISLCLEKCIIGLLSIRENLDQEENSTLLAPEVPWYERF